MTEETELLDTPNVWDAPSSDPIEATEVSISFSEYTQEISEDLVVTTFGDGRVVDKSGPFDTRENAEAFGTSFLSALSDGSIKPNPASL
jgi:hypothetical protein